jgi:hypothetical protein
MPQTVAKAAQSEPVLMPEKAGPANMKAVLPNPMQGPTSDSSHKPYTHGPAIWDLLVAAHGSVKATAFTMSNTDPSLLRRQILDGTLPLKKLLEADPRALAAFGAYLVEQFNGATKSKREIALERIPELLAAFLDAVSDREAK